jgi:DNA polymerase II large subunit
MNTNEYFQHIQTEVEKAYAFAKDAKSIGIDPVADVEVPIAMTLAEKTVGLISTIYPQLQDKRIVDRIIALEQEHGALNIGVAFLIAEEIAREKYCKFESLLQAIDAGIRVGFSYVTIGVVSSPLEGFTELKLGRTKEGKEYFKAYFSGPIRSAGTTAACVVLMLIDYLRETFGYARYDPSEDEVRRYVTENYDYHERVNNLQYLPTEEEIVFLAKNLPIQITGEPSEDREVSNYKDLPRIETNFIRGGMCLIFSEGLAQKAQKGLRLLKGFKDKGFTSTGWDFLDEYVTLHKKREKGTTDTSPTYIKDLVAGRPVFSHPSRSGGFRFRYGRGRLSGFSATSVHPATMGISDSFLGIGTQLKIEKPTKGCAITVCDSIDGPIVKLRSGNVRRVTTLAEAKALYPEVEEILYFGDLLVSFGDVANRNYELLKQGYVEEWWKLELDKAFGKPLPLDAWAVSLEDALSYSTQYNIPLHPRYIYYWKELSTELFTGLLEWCSKGRYEQGKLILPWATHLREHHTYGKRALELGGIPHDVFLDHVIVSGEDARALLLNLGWREQEGLESYFTRIRALLSEGTPLAHVQTLCPFVVKDKSGTWIGARMGRPEKAKVRVLAGGPHALFPVGEEGGRLRDVHAALEVGKVTAEFPLFKCTACAHNTIYPRCEKCGERCMKYTLPSPREGKEIDYASQSIPIRDYFEHAKKQLGMTSDQAPLIKGVRGTSNKDHSCEPLAKGFLRAKYGLQVNKDGTIRYDMTELPVSHFKPCEIGTSVARLHSLGYTQDYQGNPLEREDQICTLFPHDVILPSCPETQDERADQALSDVARFVDDELEKLYQKSKFFSITKKEDIIGHLVVCIAPHICTATIGRIVGFSKNQGMMASPFMHAAMRRDCDGDEAAVMLLMDMLLNFSRKFLPAHRGGTQDAPLVLNVKINPGDVDDQILDFELGTYPLALYELAEQGKHSSECKGIDTVKSRLKAGVDVFSTVAFTHDVRDFNHAVLNSSYKALPSMQEKVDAMMRLCEKLRAVDVQDVSRLVIERHFIRDTRGNLRKFSQQAFRCAGCNESFRRPPLAGKCTKCGGKLLFTISEGSVLKYMQPALQLARTYKVSPYLLESLELTELYIQSVFGKEKEKQATLF